MAARWSTKYMYQICLQHLHGCGSCSRRAGPINLPVNGITHTLQGEFVHLVGLRVQHNVWSCQQSVHLEKGLVPSQLIVEPVQVGDDQLNNTHKCTIQHLQLQLHFTANTDNNSCQSKSEAPTHRNSLTHTHRQASTHACMHTCMHARTQHARTHARTHAHTHTCTHTHTHYIQTASFIKTCKQKRSHSAPCLP